MIEIKLQNGKKHLALLFDDIDADLANVRWYFLGRYCGYRENVDGKVQTYMAHRVVMSRMLGRDLETHEQVRFINGDKLDNRRENLKLIVKSENHKKRELSEYVANPTIQVRSPEMRKVAILESSKQGISMNNLVYNLLKEDFEELGHELPDFTLPGGWRGNRENNKKPKRYFSRAKYYLAQFNDHRKITGRRIKTRTVVDLAIDLEINYELLRVLFRETAITEDLIDFEIAQKVADFFKIELSELLKEAE